MKKCLACLVPLLVTGLVACSNPGPEPRDAGGTSQAGEPSQNSTAAARTPHAATAAAPAESPAVPPSGAGGGAPAPSGFDGTTIPPRCHGVYAAEGRCDATGDESRLVVQADTVRFHESSGSVVRARGEGDALTVALTLTGEGQTREAEYAFRREDDGRRLVDTTNGMTRIRCDEKAGG